MKTYEVCPGDKIGKVVKRLIALANKTKETITVEFQGIVLAVEPGDNPGDIVELYLIERERLDDEAEVKLTFGELSKGDMFIVFPIPGDNQGHGGFKGTHRIFRKIVFFGGSPPLVLIRAEKWSTGELCEIPDSTQVIRVA